VIYVVLALFFQRVRIGLEIPWAPGHPQSPSERKEKDGNETKEQNRRKIQFRVASAFQNWTSCSLSERKRELN